MARSILAVLAGYATFGASAVLLFQLSGRDPRAVPETGFLVFSVLYCAGVALLGGYLAAAIARRREALHAGILAGILALIAVVSAYLKPPGSSAWSQAAALFAGAPGALLGGLLRGRSHAA